MARKPSSKLDRKVRLRSAVASRWTECSADFVGKGRHVSATAGVTPVLGHGMRRVRSIEVKATADWL